MLRRRADSYRDGHPGPEDALLVIEVADTTSAYDRDVLPLYASSGVPKRAIYRILDPYFAFWFRFIAANRSQIARGLGVQLVDRRILPGLDDHMGHQHCFTSARSDRNVL